MLGCPESDWRLTLPRIVRKKKKWEKNLPKMYNENEAKGVLQQKLEEAAEQTYQELDQLELSGISPDEAWQIVRERYLFLPEEKPY